MSQQLPGKPENWDQYSSIQKRDWRLERWLSSADTIEFVNKEARERYIKRVKRLTAVYRLEEPDRVPVFIRPGMLPLYEKGLDYHTGVYDPDKAVKACIEYNLEHAEDFDGFHMSEIIPGRAFDILGYGLYAWPGHGMAKTDTCFQFVEKEYMKAAEYDDLIRDPSDFWLRKYLPRIFSSFSSLPLLNPITDIIEMPIPQLSVLGTPEVQETLRNLLEAGGEMNKFLKATSEFNKAAKENGYPSAKTVMVRAAFDILGDTLRGTSAIMKDIYRNPDRLLAALDVLASLTIKSFRESPRNADSLMATFPLHKGADGWMSQKHFDTFYWPSLKKVMNAFIEDGMIVSLFAEGGYNTRLETINEFPPGFVHWWFDNTDMARAKKILGKTCSISGNVPASKLVVGEPAEVRDYCRKLIEDCAPGGGYMLACGALPEFPKLENAKEMVLTAKEYGRYPLKF